MELVTQPLLRASTESSIWNGQSINPNLLASSELGFYMVSNSLILFFGLIAIIIHSRPQDPRREADVLHFIVGDKCVKPTCTVVPIQTGESDTIANKNPFSHLSKA